MTKRYRVTTSPGAHCKMGRLLIGRDGDAEAYMEWSGIKQSHADGNRFCCGSLHSLVHQPDAPVPIQQVLEPEPNRLVAFDDTEDGEPRIRQRLRQGAIGRIQRSGFLLEEPVIGPPAALIRFEEIGRAHV